MCVPKWVQSLVVAGGVVGGAAAIPESLQASGALFDKASAVGGSVGQTPGTFGFYFTPNEDVYVTRLGAFNYSQYSSGTAVLEVWQQGAATAEASATVTLGGSSPLEADFDYVFAPVAGSPQPKLLAGIHYLLVWKNNLGDAVQPFANGVHVAVNGPIAEYNVPTVTPGLLTLNYTYIFTGSSLTGINPWDEQHVDGWEKSVISGHPPYMDVNIEVVSVPEPVRATAISGMALLMFSLARRGVRFHRSRF